jgi:uncharacterized Rmd1/YagE family protein
VDEPSERGRSTEVPVWACAFANTFRLRELVPLFTERGAEASVQHDELHARMPDGTVVLGFDFGALVFFGGDEPRRADLVARVATAVAEKAAPRTDEFLVEVAAGARPEVRFDRVVVPELSQPVREVVGLLVAQSAAMDYYEEDVGHILAETERITVELGERGSTRGRVRDLTRFIGRCIGTKNDVIETLALFDKPDVTWEDEALDRLFTSLRKMLEIDDRFRALEYRLHTIQDSLVLLVELSRGRATYRLEVMVVLLILFELIIMIWQSWRGQAH